MSAGRIAVVDDDTTFLALMTELLETEGYEVIACESGTRAQPVMRDLRPDLVILDLVMEQPDSGWLTLSGLQRDPVTAAIPVLVCSADGMTLRDRSQALHEQGYDTLEKPFDLDDLLVKVRLHTHGIDGRHGRAN